MKNTKPNQSCRYPNSLCSPSNSEKLREEHPKALNTPSAARLVTLIGITLLLQNVHAEPDSSGEMIPSRPDASEGATKSEELVTPGTEDEEAEPSNEVVVAGLKMLDPSAVNESFRRGEVLVSGGANGRVSGTLIYPIKIKNLPNAFHFSRDEFGEWTVSYGEMKKITVELKGSREDSKIDREKSDDLDGANKVIPKSDVESRGTSSVDEAAAPNPPEGIVRAGARMLDRAMAVKPFRRGRELVSGGGNGRSEGVTIYPVKFEGMPQTIHYAQDEFGDWNVSIGDMKFLAIDADDSAPDARTSANPEKSVADAENLESELVKIDGKIALEKKRWHEATAVINRLTNFKRTPVKEGSPEYYRCVEASRIIKEVESGSAALLSEKKRLEKVLESKAAP